ncbi:MAG TPA: phosphoribosylanthranilate isomerase [Noviherbaspirillum sp.]
MLHRTRIKICGLTRRADLEASVQAGADALGLVFYPKSVRYLAPDSAGTLIASLPPFVSTVGLFVNASLDEVIAAVERAPVSILQFHGDETIEQCVTIAHALRRPFMRALSVGAGTAQDDLLECERQYRAASPLFSGLVLDAVVEGYGGGGKVFDWSLVPQELAPRAVLSGGLNAQNVADAIDQLHPYALDVSSGVEASRGVKDPARIRAFIAAVRQADAATSQ